MARKFYSDQDREAIKETLLKKILECITDKGIIHSSIDFLCKETGISKSFFYSLFSSKEELVLSALCYQQPKLLAYAQSLMDSPELSWREGVECFLRNCCYGSETGIAVLSMEEEQEMFRCLTPENYQAFQRDQMIFYSKLLSIFGVPVTEVDPRLFGNMALSMIMVYKAMPDHLPFLFPEVSKDMVELQIHMLADKMEEVREKSTKEP